MTPRATARVANIGPRGCRRRIVMGVATLAVGLLALAVFVLTGADRGWRTVLFLPFWAGALGVSQARRHT